MKFLANLNLKLFCCLCVSGAEWCNSELCDWLCWVEKMTQTPIYISFPLCTLSGLITLIFTSRFTFISLASHITEGIAGVENYEKIRSIRWRLLQARGFNSCLSLWSRAHGLRHDPNKRRERWHLLLHIWCQSFREMFESIKYHAWKRAPRTI